jgi:coenzyme F420-0:L-glutamate ligase/coenzyme F420-1:gamma-L-glutamate ligase
MMATTPSPSVIMSIPSLSLRAIAGIPLVVRGDDLATIIVAALRTGGESLQDGDILAVAQKIVSKAAGRIVDLGTVVPSARALELAAQAGKDPRQVELILAESRRVLRCKPGVIIVEHRSGVVLANAGIDRSNVGGDDGHEWVTLLPEDADAAAADLRQRIAALSGRRIGVIVTDSIGRAWRLGTTGVAIGAAGVRVLHDQRGSHDLFGRELHVTMTADADSLAAAACLLMGEGRDATPVVLIRGFAAPDPGHGARHLLRPMDEDLFR